MGAYNHLMGSTMSKKGSGKPAKIHDNVASKMMEDKHQRKEKRQQASQFSFGEIITIEQQLFGAIANMASLGAVIKQFLPNANGSEKEQLVRIAASLNSDLKHYKTKAEELRYKRIDIQNAMNVPESENDSMQSAESIGFDALSLIGLFEEFYALSESFNSVLVNGTQKDINTLIASITADKQGAL